MDKRKVSPRSGRKWMIIAAVTLVVTVVLVVFFMQWHSNREEQKKVDKGVAYLTKLEKQNVSEIGETINAIHAEQNLALADSDEAAVWISFENAAVLGDSRAVGFSFHEFLPEERVMAQGGGKITDVPQYYDQLKALNPDKIFLCFGLNDVGIGLWPTGEEYAAECEQQIKALQAELPDSQIYLNSILPAVGIGLEADPDYPRIGEYNEALKKMTEEKGYHFIDNALVAEEHQDLYQEDGLHVQPDFYKYWAANMIAGVNES